MKSKIEIFESNIFDGIMSRNKKFYLKSMSQEEINQEFLETRLKIGNKYGFNGKKVFQATHKSNTNIDYPDGKCIIINEEHMKKEDFWYEELPADILIIESKYCNIVLGNQTGDCPVLIAEDRKLGVTALSHCGAIQINREIPKMTIEALIKEFKSNPADIYTYIGSCIHKESYLYDTYPNWATNIKIWKYNIEETENGFYIDLVNAIIEQLKEIEIENIETSKVDTATDPHYASHYAHEHGKQKKLGQSFVGFYYK